MYIFLKENDGTHAGQVENTNLLSDVSNSNSVKYGNFPFDDADGGINMDYDSKQYTEEDETYAELQTCTTSVADTLSAITQQLLNVQWKISHASDRQLQADYEELKITHANLQAKLSNTEQQLINVQAKNIKLWEQLSSDKMASSCLQIKYKDLLKNYEELQTINLDLKNKLSIAEQELLTKQPMKTSSEAWIVSCDQFQLEKQIGEGSFATVHKTIFRGTKAAAKRFKLVESLDLEQFHREMKMAFYCKHENIVTYLAVTIEDDRPIILMELMDIDLRKAYRVKKCIQDQQIPGIFCNIANALNYLHTIKPDPVIHRDVSSTNVLLKDCGDEKWLAKLGDLGTARLKLNSATPTPGAPAYAAPEAANYSGHSTKMDVYSFGVLLVEVLTKIRDEEKLDALKDEVKERFQQYHRLVTSCTSEQPKDRPTMHQVIEQLNIIAATVA